jgi:hypothetical protein
MKKRRLGLWGALALLAIIVLTVLAAPARNQLTSCSTYSHSPDGYAAWYDYMQQRGTPLQRWQKPPTDWLESGVNEKRTLIRVYNRLTWGRFSGEEYRWVEKGNRMIVLGIKTPVTPASFTSYLDSKFGKVRIDTTRREKNGEQILGDHFGSVAWRKKVELGEIIYLNTSHLAANAYQDSPGNYEFLAKLVSEDNYPLWIDEYLHGYKDADIIDQEVGGNIWAYWSKTPVMLLIFQVLIIFLLAIWGENHRFGQAATLTHPKINNTEAYIEALARVLYRANSSDFVLSAITQSESKKLQKKLGLETGDIQLIIDAWIQQKGGSAQELVTLLKTAQTKKKLGDKELSTWLNNWQKLKTQFTIDN